MNKTVLGVEFRNKSLTLRKPCSIHATGAMQAHFAQWYILNKCRQNEHTFCKRRCQGNVQDRLFTRMMLASRALNCLVQLL